MKRTLIAAALCLLLSAVTASPALAAADIRDYVSDYADVLPALLESDIVTLNVNLEQACKGAQIVVVTESYLNSRQLEDYAADLFNDRGIGDPDANNGMLLIFSKFDKKVWLTVGAGISDDFTNEMVEDYFDAYFWDEFDAGHFELATIQLLSALRNWYADYYHTNFYSKWPSTLVAEHAKKASQAQITGDDAGQPSNTQESTDNQAPASSGDSGVNQGPVTNSNSVNVSQTPASNSSDGENQKVPSSGYTDGIQVKTPAAAAFTSGAPMYSGSSLSLDWLPLVLIVLLFILVPSAVYASRRRRSAPDSQADDHAQGSSFGRFVSGSTGNSSDHGDDEDKKDDKTGPYASSFSHIERRNHGNDDADGYTHGSDTADDKSVGSSFSRYASNGVSFDGKGSAGGRAEASHADAGRHGGYGSFGGTQRGTGHGGGGFAGNGSGRGGSHATGAGSSSSSSATGSGGFGGFKGGSGGSVSRGKGGNSGGGGGRR